MGLDSSGMRAVALVATTLLAMGTYHGVEPVFRTWEPRRRSSIFLALLAALLVNEGMLAALRASLPTQNVGPSAFDLRSWSPILGNPPQPLTPPSPPHSPRIRMPDQAYPAQLHKVQIFL